MEMIEKNNAQGSLNEIEIEKGFIVLKHQNDTEETVLVTKDVDCSFIQFHFSLKGTSKFNFNDGAYSLNVGEESALLLYNPQRDLPINLEIEPNSWLVSILISIKKFHSLFSAEADYIDFLSADNKDKKYYNDSKITPIMAVVLHQLFNTTLNKYIQPLYTKGKAYELLSLYFNKEDADIEQCPFLIDEENILKIRKAKEIVLNNMAEPPGLQELANEVGLNVKKLKVGFKQLYGDTVYSFLFDYKMEFARKMLETGEHNVNEISLRIGYSTPSHFISAFKKKYGTTPKQYIMALR
ncbi:AraC family transcriptional regulator [Neptunitalea lumnitzerae]|uniref:AraC family transcriptional regulator n=1 Tax=Neptunitalea lumnitzerae TaxID=2965509 RepID=A0ABQ5MFP6_9FLAO|nr:AraC family transcriptional regulator [Neptunitalea sp. Y10]GLB48241.1 AraC family transcriptional regulator [Neptunitalea sp. Y10]